MLVRAVGDLLGEVPALGDGRHVGSVVRQHLLQHVPRLVEIVGIDEDAVVEPPLS
ncbi:MAG: hypothetical protein M3P53_04700 [Actinomycetota bacterium]|nr:hypothetical protein [Actinomycetota bacterium]